MEKDTILRSRLRVKGQITVPSEIRNLLKAEEGDELVFLVDENDRVYIERVQIIPPDQAWFWRDRWQRMEREAQLDIENKRLHHFDSTEETLKFLDNVAGDNDAENHID